MPTHSVSKLLGESAELRPLQERLDAINRLQQRYRIVAPGELAKASRVCAIDGTIVVICASSGPVAAALRQLAPRILAALRQSATEGAPRNYLKENEKAELTGIRVEVQVERKPPRRAVRARSPMPAEKLAALAGELSDSPLKSTLERIGRAHSKRTREKT